VIFEPFNVNIHLFQLINCIYFQAVENRALMYVYRYLETVEVQVLGVEISTGGLTESKVRSFEAFLTIY
jgi:hypothetical protein